MKIFIIRLIVFGFEINRVGEDFLKKFFKFRIDCEFKKVTFLIITLQSNVLRKLE